MGNDKPLVNLPKTEEGDAVGQLAGTVSLLIELLSRFIRNNDDDRQISASLREDVRELRVDIEKISKVLHEGNGEKAVTTRLALLERGLSSLNESFLESSRDKKEVNTANISGKWSVIVAIIAALSLIAAAILGSKIL